MGPLPFLSLADAPGRKKEMALGATATTVVGRSMRFLDG
jgi:hypothetical protein